MVEKKKLPVNATGRPAPVQTAVFIMPEPEYAEPFDVAVMECCSRHFTVVRRTYEEWENVHGADMIVITMTGNPPSQWWNDSQAGYLTGLVAATHIHRRIPNHAPIVIVCAEGVGIAMERHIRSAVPRAGNPTIFKEGSETLDMILCFAGIHVDSQSELLRLTSRSIIATRFVEQSAAVFERMTSRR